MNDFTFLYRGRDTSASPEQMQQTMQKWRSWFKELGEKGHVKDIGHPLEMRARWSRASRKQSPTAHLPKPKMWLAALR